MTELAFQNPGFLPFFALALLPLIIHLLVRVKAQKYLFCKSLSWRCFGGYAALLFCARIYKNKSDKINYRNFYMVWYSLRTHNSFRCKKSLAAFATVERERNSSSRRFYYKGGSPNGSSDNFP